MAKQSNLLLSEHIFASPPTNVLFGLHLRHVRELPVIFHVD